MQTFSLPKAPHLMAIGDIMRFAHKITKAVHKAGDTYSVTFGQSLKLVFRLVKLGMKQAFKPSPMQCTIVALSAFLVLFCLGFTGFSIDNQSLVYGMVFSAMACVAGFIGLTAIARPVNIQIKLIA